ncbi:MAG TPA: hypothetical protein PKK26_17910 [Candidatus Wallbacteria bacterium]|nr:hypothetical protein [Candidatus Wallbacteria bacterium]
MKLDFNRLFQIMTIIIMAYIILVLNTIYQGKLSLAQTSATGPEIPAFPLKITNLEQFSPKFVSSFSVNKENEFVVVDSQNRTIMFYEIVWNGPTASLQVKAHTSF